MSSLGYLASYCLFIINELFLYVCGKKKNKPNPKPGLTRHVLLHVVMSDALKIFY